MKLISIVVPCLDEEEALPFYYRNMCGIMGQMCEVRFELIFVDDGSTDGTLEILRELSRRDARCRYLSFSRNFGKEAAICAGLRSAKGDYTATMDVDLQDPPELLPKMYELVSSGVCDCAAARRVTRDGESWLRSRLSQEFYRCANRIAKTELVSGARDFRLMSRRMTEAVLELGECSRFSKGLFSWVGFRTEWLAYENVERSAGRTKWSLGKLFGYALEGIAGMSTAPLMLASLLGFLFLLLSGGMLAAAGIWAATGRGAVTAGYLLGCLVVFAGGVQLLCMGISAWYLSRTYIEVKHRPVYILQETDETERVGTGAAKAAAGQVQGVAEEYVCRDLDERQCDRRRADEQQCDRRRADERRRDRKGAAGQPQPGIILRPLPTELGMEHCVSAAAQSDGMGREPF